MAKKTAVPLRVVTFRLSQDTLDQLDRYAAHHFLSGRTEAIRKLARIADKNKSRKSPDGH